MANFLFLASKGRFVEKASLPLGTDNVVVSFLKASGLEADSTMKIKTTLASVMGASTEATFTTYARKVYAAADITISTNTGTGVVTLDIADNVITSAGGASNDILGAAIVSYRPTSSSTDAQCLPISKHDYTATTTGGTLTATIPSIATAT